MAGLRPSSSNAVHVARGASYALIQNLVANAAMVVSFAILARLITPAELGILVSFNLVVGFTQAVIASALRQAATKFVAETLTRDELDVATSVFYQSLRASLLLAAPIGLAIYLGASALSTQLLRDQAHAIYFQVLGVDVVVSTGVLPIFLGTLLGLQKFKETAIIGAVSTLFRQALIIILIIILRSFIGLVVAWVVSDITGALLYALYLSRFIGPPTFEFPLRKLLSFSWPLCISSTVTFAYSYFDSAVLLVFVPLATLGIYGAAVTAFSVLLAISVSITTTLFPAYSAMHIPDQPLGLSTAAKLASRYVCFVVVPLALGLLAAAKPALAIFVGEVYVQGSVPLMILSGSFAITAVGIALGPIIPALGETRAVSAIATVSVAVSLATAVLLLPLLGMSGASAARGFGMILTTALTILYLSRKLSLRLDLKAITKSLVAGAVMAAAVMLIQIPLYSKFLLPVYVLVGATTYLMMLRLLKAVRREDIALIRSYLGDRLAFVTNFLSRILL